MGILRQKLSSHVMQPSISKLAKDTILRQESSLTRSTEISECTIINNSGGSKALLEK